MDQSNLIQQLIDAINSGAAASGSPMETAPSGQSGLNPFFSTPMYQLLYGDQANQIDPTQRFKADPGYQFAQDEAFKQMQRSGAARGLLESGPLQEALLTQAQGIADQNYQRWLGQQGNLFGSYQNQLSQLAGLGQQATNAQAGDTTNTYNMLSQLLGGYNMNTGAAIGGATMGANTDIANLLANLGSANASMILNNAGATVGSNQFQQGMGLQQQSMNNQAYANQNSNNQMSALLGWRF